MTETVIETAEMVRRGERSAVEVVESCLAAIDATNGELNAFVHLDADAARAAAARIDAAIAAGDDPGPLAGVPFGVKDLEDCAGMPTSHGSLLFKDTDPVAADSMHVARLRAAGAIPLGKTAAPEFGTLQYTRTKAWGVTRNAWDPSRTPGGSSGGSAAAVAAGMVPFCTASDGGGSTRIPASFSGLFGMKPSHGRIPDHSNNSQTAVVGALTTTVTDSARHLDVTSGPDDRDRTSLPPHGLTYERVIEELDVAGLRAVWSPDLGFAAVDPEVREIAGAAAATLLESASLVDVERPVRFTDPVRVWLGEGSLDLWEHLDRHGHWPERGDEMTGFVRFALRATESRPVPTLVPSLRRRQQLQDEMAELFADVDVLLTPTTAVAAFVAEGPPPSEIDGREVDPGGSVPFTMLANLCWNPACSIPAGFTSEGLPVGLQVVGRRHRDDVVLRLARIFEQARPWPRLAPSRASA